MHASVQEHQQLDGWCVVAAATVQTAYDADAGCCALLTRQQLQRHVYGPLGLSDRATP
jgi:hypothetical protein